MKSIHEKRMMEMKRIVKDIYRMKRTQDNNQSMIVYDYLHTYKTDCFEKRTTLEHRHTRGKMIMKDLERLLYSHMDEQLHFYG